MSKVVEKNAAEIIIVALFTIIMMSSCSSTKNTCAAYASVEVENNNN